MMNRIFLSILSLVFITQSFAQRPREIQLSDDPIVWTDPWSIAMYIVLPIALVLAAILLRYRFKRMKNKQN